MTIRKLASIVTIDSVVRHPNADRLNLATIGGWQVVVGLDIAAGAKGVYFEIDSILPEDSNWYKRTGLDKPLIKSKKIRGSLSQGLFIPISEFDESLTEFEIGTDVTELLKVTKRPDLVPEVSGKGIVYEQVFPSGPVKTDEPRLQSNMYMLDYIRGKPYYITLKYDGSSMTAALDDDGQLMVCSRNLLVSADDSASHFNKVAIKYDLAAKLRKHPEWVVQGEVCGDKIQKNPLNIAKGDYVFYCFNIWDRSKHSRLSYTKLIAACTELELPMVNIVESRDCFNYNLNDLLEMATGTYDGTKNPREGIVIRSQEPMFTDKGLFVSFKVINNDYLLKNGW